METKTNVKKYNFHILINQNALFSHLLELHQNAPRCPPRDQELQTRKVRRRPLMLSSLTVSEEDSWYCHNFNNKYTLFQLVFVSFVKRLTHL